MLNLAIYNTISYNTVNNNITKITRVCKFIVSFNENINWNL